MLAGCAPSVRAVLSAASPGGFHPALFSWACGAAAVPGGGGTLSRMLHGSPLVGELPIDPGAEPHVVRVATVSRAELIAESEAIAARLAARASALGRRQEFGDGDVRQIWEATLDEVAKGRMSEPVRWDLADKSLLICRRFGVWQVTSSGGRKLRVIDDFAENRVNDASSVRRRIRMGSLLDLRGCARRLRAAFPGRSLRLIKADFKSAYRAVPVAPEDLVFARVLLVNPDDGALYVSVQYAMPFGAVGAVYARDGLAECVAVILARLFHIPVIRYVDDLFLVVPEGLEGIIHSALHLCVALLGLTLDPVKSPLPDVQAIILGVKVTCLSDSLEFEVEESKVAFWVQQLHEVAEGRPQSPQELHKLVGRLSFGCWAVWGQGAAAQLAPFYRAVFSGDVRSPGLREAAQWWIAHLSGAVCRVMAYRLSPAALPPCVIYTDAEGSGGVGACLFRHGKHLWWGARAPRSMRELHEVLGYPRKMPVFVYEAVVPFLALRLWGERLRNRRVLFYVDNTSALGALRRGRSRLSPALNALVFEWWKLARSFGIEASFMWVPSRFNPADPPSRGSPPPVVGLRITSPASAAWVEVVTLLTRGL